MPVLGTEVRIKSVCTPADTSVTALRVGSLALVLALPLALALAVAVADAAADAASTRVRIHACRACLWYASHLASQAMSLASQAMSIVCVAMACDPRCHAPAIQVIQGKALMHGEQMRAGSM